MKYQDKIETVKEWEDTAENKPSVKTNIKIRVTAEQSVRVQEICFKNGIKWSFSGCDISHIDKPYLFILDDNSLAFGIDYRDFEYDPKEKVSADLFIRTNGLCEEIESVPTINKSLDNIVDEAIEEVTNEEYDNSINNGGKTDYYQLENAPFPINDFDDFAEWRGLNGSQFNMGKVMWTFNVGRHNGTDYERDLNKIIHYANRELLRLKRSKG